MPEVASRAKVLAFQLAILLAGSCCSPTKDSEKFFITYSIATNQNNGAREALTDINSINKTTRKQGVEEKIIQTTQGSEGSTTTTNTTETSPIPLRTAAAATQKTVCPDYNVSFSAGKDGARSNISPCVATVVRAAIDYCVERTLGDDVFDQTFRRLSAGGAAVAAGVGAAIAAAAGANPALGSAVAAGASLFGGSSIPLITEPAGQHTVEIEKMTKSAQEYVQLMPTWSTSDPDDVRQYYAGLWNVVGSACPVGHFQAVVPRRHLYYVQKIEKDYWAAIQGGEAWGTRWYRFNNQNEANEKVKQLACDHIPAEAIYYDENGLITRTKFDDSCALKAPGPSWPET